MNGGMLQPSTEIFTSERGLASLNTFSSALNVPLRPDACSMAMVSSWADRPLTDTVTLANNPITREIKLVSAWWFACPGGLTVRVLSPSPSLSVGEADPVGASRLLVSARAGADAGHRSVVALARARGIASPLGDIANRDCPPVP